MPKATLLRGRSGKPGFGLNRTARRRSLAFLRGKPRWNRTTLKSKQRGNFHLTFSSRKLIAQAIVQGTALILQTDIVSGPMGGAGTTGDENGLGGYISFYGINFGLQAGMGTTTKAFIGPQEVDNYRYLGPAKVDTIDGMFTPGMQHLCCQLGALGALTNGTNYPVSITVGGASSNVDKLFMPNPGKVVWCDTVNGSDTGTRGGLATPWKTPQLITGGEISGGMVTSTNATPGAQLIFRTGTYSTSGKDGCCWRFFRITGLPPTGATNTGYIHNTAYPGPINGNAIEVITIFRPSGALSGIGGNDNARGIEATPYGTNGFAWGITISNFVMNNDPGSQDGPINVGANGANWRICNCELGPWLANVYGKAAGVAGNGPNVVVFGNYIHDIISPTNENHGVYLDGSQNTNTQGWVAQNWDVSFNFIKNMNGGSGIQLFGNGGPNNEWMNGIMIHHNYINGTAKYGINVADATQTCVVYDNVVMNTGSYALRTNCTDAGLPGAQTIGVSFIHNTCYNWMTASTGGGNSAYSNEWNFTRAGTYCELVSNLFILGKGRTNTGATWITNGATDSVGAIQPKDNCYWDPDNINTTKYSGDTLGFWGNPKVTSLGPSVFDFRLQPTSPCINAGTASTHFTVLVDFNNNPRPKVGNTNPSQGAYETVAS